MTRAGEASVTQRPLIVGMNDPYSSDPSRALWPDPPGCSGHRLWRLVNEYCGMALDEYVAAFDRRNLCRGRQWTAIEARAEGARLAAEAEGCVVMLGREVRHAIGMHDAAAPCSWTATYRDGAGVKATWWYLPHPSGRCHWYNYAANRRAAGALLSRLVGR